MLPDFPLPNNGMVDFYNTCSSAYCFIFAEIYVHVTGHPTAKGPTVINNPPSGGQNMAEQGSAELIPRQNDFIGMAFCHYQTKQ